MPPKTLSEKDEERIEKAASEAASMLAWMGIVCFMLGLVVAYAGLMTAHNRGCEQRCWPMQMNDMSTDKGCECVDSNPRSNQGD